MLISYSKSYKSDVNLDISEKDLLKNRASHLDWEFVGIVLLLSSVILGIQSNILNSLCDYHRNEYTSSENRDTPINSLNLLSVPNTLYSSLSDKTLSSTSKTSSKECIHYSLNAICISYSVPSTI